jgi:hypothetical protein
MNHNGRKRKAAIATPLHWSLYLAYEGQPGAVYQGALRNFSALTMPSHSTSAKAKTWGEIRNGKTEEKAQQSVYAPNQPDDTDHNCSRPWNHDPKDFVGMNEKGQLAPKK